MILPQDAQNRSVKASVNIEASHKGTLQRSVITSWRISSVSKKVVIQSFQKAVVI